VTITPQQQSNIITITASSKSADTSAKIANAFAYALVERRTEQYQLALRQVIADLSSRLRAVRAGSDEGAAIASQLAAFRALSSDRDPTLEVVSPAVPPSAPVWPRPVLNIAIAAVIGILVGIGAAFGAEFANPRVSRVDSLLGEYGYPMLARIPRIGDDDVRAALANSSAAPLDVLAPVRTLWAKLGVLQPDQSQSGRWRPEKPRDRSHTVLITSVDKGKSDGGPAVSAVLAGLMAHTGMSVVLVDADLERGPLTAMVDGKAASIVSVQQDSGSEDVSVLRNAGEPAQMSHRLQALLVNPEDRLSGSVSPSSFLAAVTDIRSQVDAVVISAPPPPAAETTILTDLADAVIIAVELDVTRRSGLTKVLADLRERGVVPAGFIVLDEASIVTRIRQSVQGRWAPL
jgi:tyrosine-protein kinase Etk/Wzc